MKKITWLHISDLHFCSQKAYDETIVLKELFKDIEKCIQENSLQPDFIIISGDISFGSKPDEYVLAKNFLDNLLKVSKVNKDRLYIVPGNHDVDRTTLTALSSDAAKILIDRSRVNSLLASDIDRSYMLERFHNYKNFINDYFEDDGIHFDTDEYFYVKMIDLVGLKIAILGLNSSWISSSNEDRGKLLLGEPQIRSALDESGDADMRLAIMHHPFDWLQDFDRRDAEAQLLNNCTFILNGHMHHPGILQITSPDYSAITIPAGACYESREHSNSYNFVQLNLENGDGKIFFRAYSQGGFWTRDVGTFRNVEDGTYPFKLPTDVFKFSELEGTNFTKAATTGQGDLRKPSIESYFGNPFPLKGNFAGRVKERKSLTEWLIGNDKQIFALVAIGGMGKSSLAWAWLNKDVLGESLAGMLLDNPDDARDCSLPKETTIDGVFWWSFYERESTFLRFVDEALIFVRKIQEPNEIASVQEKVKLLINALREKFFLFILDGFERELRAYANLNAAYQESADENNCKDDFNRCVDFNADTFLRWATSGNLRSRILITSRILPHELNSTASCIPWQLTGLDPNDAVKYIQSQNIRGSKDEIEKICADYAYHPLAIRILIGMIIFDPVLPRDIRAASSYDPVPDLKQREHHILELAYNQLDPYLRDLLSRIAAFRSSLDYNATKVINPFDNEAKLKGALRELIERGLVQFDHDRVRYDLHPVVREYAYTKLQDKIRVHNELISYYSSKTDSKFGEGLEKFKDIIELFHHTVKAGLFDEAFTIFSQKLSQSLFL
jgi:Predicted phosphohydrolases